MNKTRMIRTDFYFGKKVVKSNFSKFADNGVVNAVRHLQSRKYDSTHCEVYDTSSGELHAVLRMSIGKDKLEVVYKRVKK